MCFFVWVNQAQQDNNTTRAGIQTTPPTSKKLMVITENKKFRIFVKHFVKLF